MDVLPAPPTPVENGHPPNCEVYSPTIRGCPHDEEYTPRETGCPMPVVPMASFARFYEARPPDKVRIVRDVRIQQSDPDGYRRRDYYNDLRNILTQTHWQTDDIGVLESAVETFIAKQKDDQKKAHFRDIAEAYIRFWKRQDASLFEVPSVEVDVAELTIRVRPEVGMRTEDGDEFALKLWFNSPRLTRQYRQANTYLMEQAQGIEWPSDWRPALWDVRRENIPPPATVARDFVLGLEGQAAAFLGIWNRLADEGF